MKKTFILVASLIAFFPCLFAPSVEGKEPDTFSISLVQQATVKKMDDREVIYEQYKVKKGDYIWEILRRRGLLKRPNLAELVSLLKGMNKSLTNLDLIHPGQTILVPLYVTPVRGYKEKQGFLQESIMGISSLKHMNLENYIVKPGDCLTMIVHGRYKMPPKFLYSEYLNLVQKFNPTLRNLDLIYPNQVIRLPIYSPEIVRMPIEPQETEISLKKSKLSLAEEAPQTLSLRKKLGDIFNQMGEEWIDTGEQFIPLRSGGQINLRADSFPVLNLSSGIRLIIDMKNELPEDISKLIQADWEDYEIVHLDTSDNLKTAMDKILAASNYYKVLKSGEQFKIKIGGDIDVSIAGDWVIIPHRGKRDIPDRIAVIAILNNLSEQTPVMLRAYLEKLGIRIIDYSDLPVPKDTKEEVPIEKKIRIEKDTDFPIPTLVLTLAGQAFSSQVKIPVYQREGSGFDLIIKANLFFNRKGKDCIIDITGLSPSVLALLKKHQFLVLSLAGEKDLSRMTVLILDFLGLPYESKPHHILASSRDETRNIALSIPGVSFHDQEGKKILATDKKIPAEIVSFLNQKGYTLLELSQLED